MLSWQVMVTSVSLHERISFASAPFGVSYKHVAQFMNKHSEPTGLYKIAITQPLSMLVHQYMGTTGISSCIVTASWPQAWPHSLELEDALLLIC